MGFMGDGVLSSVLPVRAKARIAPGHISAFPLLLCVCVRRVCVSLSLLFFLPSPLVFPPPNPVQRSLFRLFSPSSVLSQCMGPVSVAVCGRSGVIVYRLARLCMSLVAMLSRALSPLSLSFPAPSVPEYSGPVRRPPPSSRLVRPISKMPRGVGTRILRPAQTHGGCLARPLQLVCSLQWLVGLARCLLAAELSLSAHSCLCVS